MAIVERNRILRPSTRLASSISYKINTEKVSGLDELIVRVYSDAKKTDSGVSFRRSRYRR